MLWNKRYKYVAVVNSDGRTEKDKWQDHEYLNLVTGLANNKIFTSEVVNALLKLREVADAAPTIEALHGMQVGIKVIKELLTAPRRAKDKLEVMNASRLPS